MNGHSAHHLHLNTNISGTTLTHEAPAPRCTAPLRLHSGKFCYCQFHMQTPVLLSMLSIKAALTAILLSFNNACKPLLVQVVASTHARYARCKNASSSLLLLPEGRIVWDDLHFGKLIEPLYVHILGPLILQTASIPL